jgi:hypothetical protein
MSEHSSTQENKPAMSVGDRVNDFTSRLGIVGELMRFLWQRKLWWLMPMVVALLIFGVLMLLGASGVLSPFIYTLF